MTSFHPVPEPPQPALSTGVSLRLRREQLGWSLPDVADWLRIKVSYLQALEDGRPQDLPGSAYAIGFLRSYASTLGLDPQELSQRFRQESRGLDRRQTLSFPAPVPERGVPAGAALLVGAVLIGLSYTGWYMAGGHEKLPVQSVPPLPASLAPDAAATARPGATTAPAAVVPGQASAAPPAPTAASVVTSPTAAPPVSAVGHQGPAAEPAMPAPAAAQVVVKASASSWVQVRQVGGPVIYERILQPGESWPVPSGSGSLLLSTGNAGGITLIAGDVTTPFLGPPGAVRRNLPLSADAIRDGRLIATSETQRPTAQQTMPQQPAFQQTGQTAPFLAGSGHGAMPPTSTGGDSYPEH